MSVSLLTVFTKSGGVLTKRIALRDGAVFSDGSACVMTEGKAQRLAVPDAAELADLILRLQQNQALAFGALRADLPDIVSILSQAKLNGATSNAISRTKLNILYEPGRPAWVLIDFDRKAMPEEVAERINHCGGVWEAIVS